MTLRDMWPILLVAAFAALILGPLQWLHPDTWWESLKARYPRLRNADVIRDQSNMMHAWTTVLLFGGLGMFVGVITGHEFDEIVTKDLAQGIFCGLFGYVVREVGSRVLGFESRPFELWDGALDMLVPFMVAFPWAVNAYFYTVAPWTGVVLVGLVAVVAFLYTFGRPSGATHYNRAEDPTP